VGVPSDGTNLKIEKYVLPYLHSMIG